MPDGTQPLPKQEVVLPERTMDRCGDAGPKARAAPTHLQGQARAFLKALGYEPKWMMGPRTAKAFLHDHAYQCTNCDDWFANASDMAEDREAECFWCRWNLWKPGEKAQAARKAA